MERTHGQRCLTMVRQGLPLSSWVCFGAPGLPVPVSVHPPPSLPAAQNMVSLVKN